MPRVKQRRIPFALIATALTGLSVLCCSSPAGERQAAADAGAATSAGESWITFLSHRTGHNILYKMHPDGSDLQPIFGGPVEDAPGLPPELTLYMEPHWTRQSPDRKWFVSWATDRVRPSRDWVPNFMLRLGSLDGGVTRVIATDADEEFAWSPDSRQLAYAAYVRPPDSAKPVLGRILSTQIRVRNTAMDTDGSNEITVLEKPGLWHVCDWSPDGKRLLLRFASALSLRYGTEDLIEYDLEAALKDKERYPPGVDWASSHGVERHLKVLTGAQAVRNFGDGRYSPDGEYIATTLSRRLDPTGEGFDPKGFELAVLERKTGKLRILAKYPEGLRGPICWSPDGREVLFSRYLASGDDREKMDGGLAIWAIGADGSNPRFLTTGWSPDWR